MLTDIDKLIIAIDYYNSLLVRLEQAKTKQEEQLMIAGFCLSVSLIYQTNYSEVKPMLKHLEDVLIELD